MPLLITIIKHPQNVSNTNPGKTFSAQGGFIGRGTNNDWVLQDPERFLSTKHCQISSVNNQYFITDLSTNGTFINGAAEPLGKGNKVELRQGDIFALGDYEFRVDECLPDQNSPGSSPFDQAIPEPGPFGASPFDSPSADDDIFGTPPQNSPFDTFNNGHVSSSEPLFSTEPEETDPLAALDKASQDLGPTSTQNNDLFTSGTSHSDQSLAINQAVSWPNTMPEGNGGAIPEDWDDDLGITPSIPITEKPAQAVIKEQPSGKIPMDDALLQEAYRRINELEQANQKLTIEMGVLKQQKTAPNMKSAAVSAEDSILINALGLGDRNLSDEKIKEISQTIGELMREMIAGMMKILSSRSSIKNEFRMSVTTIQPVENNPLKFSVTVDDALENMFLKKGNAYKPPKESVEEGFLGIAEHQMAVLSGMRAAFKGIIERFDPVLLEKRFEKQNKGGLIPGIKNAKNWELFCDYYNDLVGDLDNSFQYLFGDDFVRAYEDQLQRLAIARNKQKIEK